MILPEVLSKALSFRILGNSAQVWLLGGGVSLLVFFGMSALRTFLKQQISEHSRLKSIELIRVIRILLNSTTILFDLALSLSVGAMFLYFSPRYSRFLSAIPFIAFLLQGGYWAKSLLSYELTRFIESKKTLEEQQQIQTLITPIKVIVLAMVWSLIILAALDNVGVNVTALVAGLGIGGVAVALAVQSTLGDLLAALAIAIDKPFIVGDFIVVDNQMGYVKRIGLKTTRITSLGGEEIVVPNNNLLNARIHNYKQMETRRIVFRFGVLYQTSHELLKEIPVILRSIIDAIALTRFDRAHFASFGESAYNFEAVYYVLDSEYSTYMDIQQTINLEMVRLFKIHQIEFAYPTRTIFVTHDPFSGKQDPHVG